MIATSEPAGRSPALGRGEALVLLGALGALVAVNLPELGSDPWPFRPPPAEPRGLLGPLVRASGGEWGPGLLRAGAALAGLLVAVVAALVLSLGRLRRSLAVTTAAVVVGLLVVPGVALQVGLREATAPWFHDNDSTYQIEIAGELVRSGESPYGHDYSRSGLERFYSLDGSVSPGTRTGQVALRHFAYFPGTPLTAGAWGVLPAPLDDYRVLVALMSLAALPAALLFRGPLGPRLALGAGLAASPLAVRAAWFGTADAPAVLAVVLAFGLLMRRRHVGAAIVLAIAVLLKQFAVVAVPFFATALLWRARRRSLVWAGVAFAAVLTVGFAPFLIAGAGALIADTIAYGGGTYRIIGYGLAGMLLEAGAIDDRFGPYPFTILALLVWLPLTAWLVRIQLGSPAVWTAAAGFAASILVLLFIGRVFQTSYLVWPLAASLLAGLLALSENSPLPAEETVPDEGSGTAGRSDEASAADAYPDPLRGRA
ncbi:MAG: DUF2029 domain-containing protein [Thermoleophilaceae bacterium]|nr:DUF2029 domain-containing protein [Thermoleophilaceae bacterium]